MVITFKFEYGMICAACKKPINTKEEMIGHHISYNPEKVVPVHRSCHIQIHKKKDKFNHLKPKDRSALTTIKISNETHKILNKIGEKGENFDDVIVRLIKASGFQWSTE